MTDTKIKTLKSIYLIYSEQKFLIKEAIKRLKKKVAGQALGQLNILEFSAPLNFELVEQALHTAGFFEQKKVVIVHQADKLLPRQAKKVDAYYDSPNPDVTLVLACSKEAKMLFSGARAKNYLFEYKAPKKGQLGQWVINTFSKEGKEVNFETARYLIGLLGNDLELLSSEIEKICLYCDSKKKLRIEDISAVSSSVSHETIFDLVDALGQADLSLALSNLNHLFQTEADGKIFHMIIRQFRLLLKTKGLLSDGSSSGQIATALRLPTFVATKYMKQTRHFDTSKLVMAHTVLLETELAYKTSSTPLSKALEMALIKILAA